MDFECLNREDEAHFLEALLALLIVLISSSKKALTILDLTHPAHRTPP